MQQVETFEGYERERVQTAVNKFLADNKDRIEVIEMQSSVSGNRGFFSYPVYMIVIRYKIG